MQIGKAFGNGNFVVDNFLAVNMPIRKPATESARKKIGGFHVHKAHQNILFGQFIVRPGNCKGAYRRGGPSNVFSMGAGVRQKCALRLGLPTAVLQWAMGTWRRKMEFAHAGTSFHDGLLIFSFEDCG